jgi:hypothetical protein
MQKTEIINISKLTEILDAVFVEPVIVYESDSEFNSNLKKYESKELLSNAIDQAIQTNLPFINFSIYYPAAKGYVFEEKVKLNPEVCNGATYRYSASGWGLIQLQIDLRDKPMIEVRVTVNTQKRAETWSANYPKFKLPSLWDWKFVEKQTRRIIKTLKSCVD